MKQYYEVLPVHLDSTPKSCMVGGNTGHFGISAMTSDGVNVDKFK